MSELAVVHENQNLFIAPVASVQDALVAYQAMKEFVKGVLKEDVDFGTIPGTGKPTLYKPGSEKLLRFFGISTSLEILEAVEDWDGSDHDGEPFFFYRYKAIASRGDVVIAEAVGSCSSWEKKYRYRTAEIKCPACGAENIRHSKNGTGWYCWAKTGGCGATFEENDTRITGQPRGVVPNPDPADLVNTIDKMAQKRAIVAVSLLACNASEYFTQDVEDYIDGTFEDLKPDQNPEPKPTPVPQPETNKGYTREDADAKEYDFKSRPYEPDTLKAALAKKADTIGEYDASDNQRNLLGALLSEYYQDDQKRHTVQLWLTGSSSTKDMDGAIVKAMLDWLKPSKDDSGAYVISEMSKKELSRILTVALIDEGQEALL